ncbi:Acyl-protein thioesterase 2 [Linum perenne]
MRFGVRDLGNVGRRWRLEFVLGSVVFGIIGSALFLANMSFTGPSMASGGKTAKRAFDFGKTFVVRPKGKHQATVVWLHGLGDNGSSWSQLLETLPLQNIKWICPTAPTRPITMFGGFPSTACKFGYIGNNVNLDSMNSGFDVRELSEDAPDDVEGLDAAANHVANLLASEPADIKIAIGGFSMGAATSLYSGTCFTMGKYADGNPYPANLTAVVGLSGWLPCSKFDFFVFFLLFTIFFFCIKIVCQYILYLVFQDIR